MYVARCVLCSLVLCSLLILGTASVAFAQGRDTGAVRGLITDPDGAPLPGVTVKLSSSDLLGGTRTVTTSAEGVYRFPGLPPGIYSVEVSLQGFRSVIFDDIIVNVGRNLTIDAEMELSGVEEMVSVIGEAPIIDTKNSSAQSTWGEAQLQDIPSAMDLWSYIQQVPGLQTNRENIGGSGSVHLDAFEVHGSEREQQQYNINGMDMTLFEHGLGLGYFNTDAFEEIQFTTSGISAEHSKGGIIINAVVRDGGNDFHGMLQGYYEGPGLQSDNVDDQLRAAGVTSTGGDLDYISLLAGNLGGPIVRDNIWFYTGGREYAVFPFKVNCERPDGERCTDGVTIRNLNLKLTSRLDDSSNLMFSSERQWYDRPTRNAGQFVAHEATWIEGFRYHNIQAKYNRIFGQNGYFDVYAGWGSPPFPLDYQEGVGNTTTAYDVVTWTALGCGQFGVLLAGAPVDDGHQLHLVSGRLAGRVPRHQGRGGAPAQLLLHPPLSQRQPRAAVRQRGTLQGAGLQLTRRGQEPPAGLDGLCPGRREDRRSHVEPGAPGGEPQRQHPRAAAPNGAVGGEFLLEAAAG